MNEIDLIPASYKRQQKTKFLLSRFAGLYALLIVSLIIGKVFLSYKATEVGEEIAILQEKQQALIAKKQVASQLQTENDEVKKQLAFVELLQQGGGADKIFQVFDRVLEKQIWMDSWSYKAADLSTNRSSKSLSMNIYIKGHALNHSALSGFVERLLAQPEISHVEVKNSSMRNKAASTVTFEMEVL